VLKLNELQTITQLTKTLDVSTRTLRYYERIGLLQSKRVEDYAYRMYDEQATARLKQIILLRKLRVPLKQIAQLLNDGSAINAIELFMQNIGELDEEITSLSTIRDILQALVDKLRESASVRIGDHLLSDKKIMALIAPLSLNKFAFKEADEKLSKLRDKDVRIVYLPPATVASARCVGGEPEHDTDVIMGNFVKDVNLFQINPGARLYGFNSPDIVGGEHRHGYEVWATIPDDLEVPAPLVKKTFAGGLYGALTSNPINFDDWQAVYSWVGSNGSFDYDRREPLGMNGCLEEHFNSYNLYGLKDKKHTLTHIDFLIPIKEKL
jgi:DNA-binding transcriptional MerR regulator